MTMPLFLILAILASQSSFSLSVTVTTSLGQVEGIETKVLNATQSVFQFRKIPYAKPPVGNLRFQKPQAFGSWSASGVLNATVFGPSCQQFIKNPLSHMLPNNDTDEDCLTLNIYVPFQVSQSSNRPVMIFIHGGGFISGQGMNYDPSVMTVKGEVIVVTFNYRLGVFGLFTTGNSSAPGNIALWDQKLAIKWVKDNIQSFGGNPNVITLFGQGAGGASVIMQSLHAPNQGLFHKIIAQSGVATSPKYFANETNMVNTSLEFAVIAGCYTAGTSSSTILTCLQTLSQNSLMGYSYSFVAPNPMVDGEFLTDTPFNLLNKSGPSQTFFRSLDLMTGTNNADGTVLLDEMVSTTVQNKYNFDIRNGIKQDVLYDLISDITDEYYKNSSSVLSELQDTYKTNSQDLGVQGRHTLMFLSDFYYHLRSVELLDIHRGEQQSSNTFSYLFTRPNDVLVSSNMVYSWIEGAPHGNELVYLFGLEEIQTRSNARNEQDIAFANKMMTYWTTFAKSGSPGLAQAGWPVYGKEGTYLLMDGNFTTAEYLYKDRLYIWIKKIPTLLNPQPTSSGLRLSSSVGVLVSLMVMILL